VPRRPRLPATQSSERLEDLLIRRTRSRRATILLAKAYGSPNHNNKRDPVDELVFIILSQMTTFPSFERVYSRLRDAAPRWEDILNMPLRRLKRIIKDAGLSNQKAPRLKTIFTRLKEDFGSVTLEPLREMKTRDAEDYLVMLPGVQRKTAKCVLMYSLERAVLPVDTHVLRVSRRLGLMTESTICDAAHTSLESVVSPQYRYDFHVNAISHGRAVCLAKAPHCARCALNGICPYPKTLSRPRL
jgi:endonuclease III